MQGETLLTHRHRNNLKFPGIENGAAITSATDGYGRDITTPGIPYPMLGMNFDVDGGGSLNIKIAGTGFGQAFVDKNVPPATPGNHGDLTPFNSVVTVPYHTKGSGEGEIKVINLLYIGSINNEQRGDVYIDRLSGLFLSSRDRNGDLVNAPSTFVVDFGDSGGGLWFNGKVYGNTWKQDASRIPYEGYVPEIAMYYTGVVSAFIPANFTFP